MTDAKELGLTPAESEELDGLYQEAESYFLDKHDFNAVEWLDEKEAARFRELYKKSRGFCPDSTCGGRDCDNCRV